MVQRERSRAPEHNGLPDLPQGGRSIAWDREREIGQAVGIESADPVMTRQQTETYSVSKSSAARMQELTLRRQRRP